MSRIAWLVLSLVCIIAVCGAVVANHLLGRPDRIRAAERRAALLSARDQILRYEDESGELPATLDALVPAYLRRDEIGDEDSPTYRYDRERRVLAQAEGALIRGLVSWRRAPLEIELPPPDAARAKPSRPPANREPPETEPGPVAPVEARPPGTKDPQVKPPDEPVEIKPVPRPPLKLVAPKGPKLPNPPDGCLVFEAEHYTDTNYGWEIHPDDACSGGAYLHCKEGIANGPGQVNQQMGDFYNVRATTDYTFLRYHFRIEKPGAYHVYGLLWTTDTHCSNQICVAVDKGGPYTGGMENRTPFRWVWSPMKDNPANLAAGDHYMHIFIHEDGVRFDQFMLSPRAMAGSQAYAPNFEPGKGTAWRAGDGPPVHLSFDLKSLVVSKDAAPECAVVLRRLREAKDAADLRVVVEGAGQPGATDLTACAGEIALSSLPEVAFVPISIAGLDLAKLPRREYVLRAELRAGGRTIAETHTPLMHPFAWEYIGPGRHLSNDDPGPLDANQEFPPGDKRAWRPFETKNFDHFGVLDFGLQTGNNSLHAPAFKTIYARTRIRVTKSNDYLFKMQADDQMLVWLDGRQVFRHDAEAPVTRAGTKLPVRLEAGEHRLRIRVNQREARWQASLRIRTKDDDLSDVEGLPPEPAPPAPEGGK